MAKIKISGIKDVKLSWIDCLSCRKRFKTFDEHNEHMRKGCPKFPEPKTNIDWEEEFDNDFISLKHYFDEHSGASWLYWQDRIKQFITDLLAEERERAYEEGSELADDAIKILENKAVAEYKSTLLEKIEELIDFPEGTEGKGISITEKYAYITGFNRALKTIKLILTK